jgi:hypothetical protein
MLPQIVGVWQSIRQLNWVSPGSQKPFPQNDDWQSRGQLKALSPGSQTRFPQSGKQYGGGAGPPGTGTQYPQSCGQLSEFSPGSHFRLPHAAPGKQSRGHENEFSLGPQTPSPQ